MRKLESTWVTSLALGLLSGCSTQAIENAKFNSADIDLARVNAVNNVAQRFGVQVEWINYPQKPTGSTAPGGS